MLRVFGRRGDPGAVALIIARALQGSEVKQIGQTWRVTVGPRRTMFRPVKPDLVVDVDAGRFSGPDADGHRAILRDDVVRRMRGPGLDNALGMIPQVRLAVSFVPTEPHGSLGPSDRIFQVALDVASRTDGFVLNLGSGRLFSQTGQLWASTELLIEDGGTPLDPSMARIQGRLVGLVAVGARALTEYDGRDLEEARDGIVHWVRSVGMSAELEDFEEVTLLRPPAELEDAELAHATWQIEGAVILAWALRLLDHLPAPEEAVDPTLLSGVLRFPDAEKTKAVLRAATRRHQAMIEAEAERQYSIYWRLSKFAEDQQSLDLEAFTRNSPTGPVHFERVPLVDGDLSIGAVSISEADPQLVDVALSISAERLRAVNWLCMGGPYSSPELGP